MSYRTLAAKSRRPGTDGASDDSDDDSDDESLPWYPELAFLTADKYRKLCLQAFEDIQQLKSRLGRDMIGPKTTEEESAWLKARNFRTRECFDAFVAAGGWNAFPNAVLIRVDMRCIKDVDVVGGKFLANMAVVADFRLLEKKVPDKDSPPFNFNLMSACHDQYFMHWDKLLDNNFVRLNKNHNNEFATIVAFENDVEFFESFQLHNFPFDVHFCKITISIKGRSFLIPYIGLLNQSMTLSEWHVLAPSWDCCVNFDEDGRRVSICTIRFVIQRKSTWFVTNFMALMSVLCTLAFYAYIMPPGDTSSRSGVTLTLLLTLTALKLVMADSLPKIAYLTMLDKYMLVGFMLLSGILMSNLAVAALGEDFELPALSDTFPDLSGQRILDLTLASALLIAWIVYHIQLTCRILLHLKRIRDVFGPPLQLGPLMMPDELKEIAQDFTGRL